MNQALQQVLSPVLQPWLALAQMWPAGMDKLLRRDYTLTLFFYKALCDVDPGQAQGAGGPDGGAWNIPVSARLERVLCGDDRHLGKRLDRALALLERSNASLKGLFGDALTVPFAAQGETDPGLLRRILGSMMRAAYDLSAQWTKYADMMAQLFLALDSRLQTALDVASAPRYMATSLETGGTWARHPADAEISLPVARLMAAIARPQAGERIYDPASSNAALLLACSQAAGKAVTHQGEMSLVPPVPPVPQAASPCLYGYSLHEQALRRSRMGLLLMGIGHSLRKLCSVAQILSHWTDACDVPVRFDLAVSVPPSHLPASWMRELAHLLPTNAGFTSQFSCDSGKAGMAFVRHMLTSVQSGSGRVLALLPGSSLLADGSDEHIRSRLLAANLVEAVIALPPWCHPAQATPVLLYLREGKQHGKVCVINASHIAKDDYVALARVARLYQQHENVPGHARWVNLNELLTENCRVDVWRIAM